MAKTVKIVTDEKAKKKAKKKKLTAILCGTLIPIGVIGGGIGGYAIYKKSAYKTLVFTMESSSSMYIVSNIKAKKTYNITLKLDPTKLEENQKLKKLAFYKIQTTDIVPIIQFNGIFCDNVALENWTVNGSDGTLICTNDANAITKDTGSEVVINVRIATTNGAFAEMKKEQ